MGCGVCRASCKSCRAWSCRTRGWRWPLSRRRRILRANMVHIRQSKANMALIRQSGANMAQIRQSRANMAHIRLSKANLARIRQSRAEMAHVRQSKANMAQIRQSWVYMRQIRQLSLVAHAAGFGLCRVAVEACQCVVIFKYLATCLNALRSDT